MSLPAQEPEFVRGDATADRILNITDGIAVLNFLFLGGAPPTCEDAADADDSGELELTDAVVILSFLFDGSARPRSPAPATVNYDPARDCGPDPTADALGCDVFLPCAALLEAVFVVEPGVVARELRFDASPSTSSSGEILVYEWEFSDDGTATGKTVVHLFPASGTYAVTLTVTDSSGAIDSTTATVTVNETNMSPRADFSASSLRGIAPLEVEFDATLSVDEDDGIQRYEWDFGDDQSGAGPLVTHVYSARGRYDVELKVTDSRGASHSVTRTIVVHDCMPGAPELDPYPEVVGEDSVTLAGTVDAAVTLTVIGPSGTLTETPEGGRFVIEVPLLPDGRNRRNKIFLTATGACGETSGVTVAAVTHDRQEPKVFIDSPQNDAELTASLIDVAGRVSDTLSGFLGLTVEVNGIPAIVDVGTGTNGTFLAQGVPLEASGATVIEAVARDARGNTSSRRIRVTRAAPDGPVLELFAGNGQEAAVQTELAQPIVVRALEADGAPFANKVVSFEVVRSDGRLNGDEGAVPLGDLTLQVLTDRDGLARAFWRLGTDAGCGNNRVLATSRGIGGQVTFCASATAGSATQVNVSGGNNQRAAAGGPAPEPLRVWVNDSCNGVVGVPVEFSVVRGGGTVGGEKLVVVKTSATGHAAVPFTFGPAGGSELIEATFPGNRGMSASFVVVGIPQDPAGATSFAGIVLDNAGRAVEGVTCSLSVNGQDEGVSVSDSAGQFRFIDISQAGPASLEIDGTTASTGVYPALHFEPLLVSGASNSLPMPVLLPQLNPSNRVEYSTTEDVRLTVEGIAGLEMTVKAGSMYINGEPAPNGTPLALNQVHFDDVPMPMPDGAAPPFAWTLQPAGAVFSPPVAVTYPNMSGLPSGAVAYFLSFDHDTGRFEIVASGRVSADGASIKSDPGAGITVAGWGCSCPPYAATGDCENERCKDSGELYGGEISVFCRSTTNTVTFRAHSVLDTGGWKETSRGCEFILPGRISYSFTLRKNGLPFDEGPVIVDASAPTVSLRPASGFDGDVLNGAWEITIVARSVRDCPPPPLVMNASAVFEDDVDCSCASRCFVHQDPPDFCTNCR